MIGFEGVPPLCGEGNTRLERRKGIRLALQGKGILAAVQRKGRYPQILFADDLKKRRGRWIG